MKILKPPLFVLVIFFFAVSSLHSRTPTKSWVEKLTPNTKKQNSLLPLRKIPEVKTDSGVTTILPDNLRSTWDAPVNFPDGSTPEYNDRTACLRNLRRYGVSLETRLNGCLTLANQVIWETASGERLSFTRWPREKVNRINEIFDRIQFGSESLGVQCPVPQEGVNVTPYEHVLYMTDAEAFDIYAVHVAHSIYLESTGLHPWSLLDIPSGELSVLLDSSYYHSRLVRSGMGRLILGRFWVGESFIRPAREYAGNTLSCDPRWAYHYALGEYNSGMESILGTNETDTLRKLTWWVNKNGFHPEGGGVDEYSPERLRDYVQLSDRLASQPLTTGTRTLAGIRFRQGCHSATLIMLDLARSLNLAILPIWTNQAVEPPNPYSLGSLVHLGLVFQWTRPTVKILHHTDDIFSYFRVFFPIDSSGHSVTDTRQLSQVLMDATWVSPATLRSYHYVIAENFPLILAGQEFLPGILGNPLMIHESDGNMGGFWQHFNYEGPFGGTTALTLYLRERQYQICAWTDYLDRICSPTRPGIQPFQDELAATLLAYSPWIETLPRIHTPAEYLTRASLCIEAHGGCDHLRSLNNDFFNDFGLGVVNPH